MTTTVLAPYLKQRFVDGNGAPLYLGTVSTFAAGTNTPIVTYKDSLGIATNTNPITLNPRGECDIWLLPNVAYKFQVNDALGNLIWTEDNVINNQLVTLYGGVDTGAANAYLLNFTASFTAYADGIIIYWIPANTNTGASTINVNGLGVLNIVHPDGSVLFPGEITANQPAQIMLKGGVFELLSTINLSGVFVPVWSGYAASPSTPASYRRSGNLVALSFSVLATSTTTSLILTNLPALITPYYANTQKIPCLGMIDNGANVTTISTAQVVGPPPIGAITFFKDASGTLWTAGGNKGSNGFLTLVYLL
jgi:hypothetical protein